ncbi:MAG: alpha/beta hydrolase [Planctomycetota bacterium]
MKTLLKKYPQADANRDGKLTLEEAKAYKNKIQSERNKQPKVERKPDFADVSYGSDSKQRFDLWLADSKTTTPLLICIHGGGFKGGDKSKYHSQAIVATMLEQGVSVATVNYRLTDGGKNPYPIPMHDCALAIQHLRHHASKYNLDPERFAATGGSAGGCISLWLAFHDDLADAKSTDPIAQQSSRLLAVAPVAAQPTLELDMFSKIFECNNLPEHPGFRPLFAIPAGGNYTVTSKVKKMMIDASPVTHLTTDDPPVFLAYSGTNRPIDENSTPGQYVHHPKLGMFLKEKMDALKMECHLQFKGGPEPKAFPDSISFLLDKLKK